MSQSELIKSEPINGELILYTTEDGKVNIRLRAEGGSVWLSQAEMAELFQTSPQNITQHIKAIYEEGEANEVATCKQYLQVRQEGERQVQRAIALYRLDIILAVGYRVRSVRGTQFRRWATTTLQEYLVKGFVIDDARLKEPAGGWDYFDELLERIREIRASEKRFYQKIRDLFTTSADYRSDEAIAQEFFQKIQNKLLWAVTRQTAAELIVARSDAKKSNMGLMAFKGGRVRKTDIAVAKNYLQEPEVKELNRLVSAFLDLAQDRAEKRQQTTMAQWVGFVDNYLKLAERPILDNPGKLSHENMMAIVAHRYDEFDTSRRAAERAKAEQEYEKECAKEVDEINKIDEIGKNTVDESNKIDEIDEIDTDLKQLERSLVKAKASRGKKDEDK
jgi:hypothetical protein